MPNGYKNATTESSIFAGLFNDSDINIDIYAGAESGLLVVDVDPGYREDEVLIDLEAKYGKSSKMPEFFEKSRPSEVKKHPDLDGDVKTLFCHY